LHPQTSGIVLETVNSMFILHYLLEVLKATLIQSLLLFGLFIILAFMMNLIARQNEKTGISVFGLKVYLYLFAWLGTAVHETGHALFALLFRHKITSMKLFSPDLASGTLGYVSHTWNKKSGYQNIGNFFIGVGPIILGSLCLYLLSIFLFGRNVIQFNFDPDFQTLFGKEELIQTAKELGVSLSHFFRYVLTGTNASWWKALILFYTLFSIGSSVSLSASDVKGAGYGFLFIILLLLAFNLVTLWIGDFAKEIILIINRFLTPFYLLILLSMAINLLFLLLLGIIVLIKNSL